MENAQVRLEHYLPHVFHLLTSGGERRQIWNRIKFCLGEVGKSTPEDDEAFFAHVYEVIRAKYSEFIRLSMNDMLYIHGYENIRKLSLGGSWSKMVEMNERGAPRSLLGKTINLLDADEPNFFGYMINEVMVASQISSVHIASLREIVFSPLNNMLAGEACLVQTKRNRDLLSALCKGEFDTPDSIINGLMDIAEGLVCMHDQQMLHLDLKPANVLCSSKHGLVLCDFGLSTRVTSQRVLEARKVTLWYRAPELIASQAANKYVTEYDQSVDIWSFGMIMWDMLCKSPMLDTVVSRASEEVSADMVSALHRLCMFLGSPSESAVSEWKVRGLPLLPSYPSGALLDAVRQYIRPALKSVPDTFLSSIVSIMEELLSWRPCQRPNASLVWSKLRLLSKGGSRELVITPRCQISSEESEWRRLSITREQVTSYWERAVTVLKQVAQYVQQKEFNEIPRFDQDPDSYLDVIMLTCELIMRTRFQESHSLNSDERLHMGCCNLAIQITRPFWSSRSYQHLYRLSRSEMQQVELYLLYKLDFCPYAENMLTEIYRSNPHARVAYNRIREAYLDQFIQS